MSSKSHSSLALVLRVIVTLERLVILDEGGVIYTHSEAVWARPSVEGHYDVPKSVLKETRR